MKSSGDGFPLRGWPDRLSSKMEHLWTCLVVQWLRIRLPMQGMWVRSQIWKDSTCHGATKPMIRNFWAHALEPRSYNCWSLPYSPCYATREATAMRSRKPRQSSPPHSPQLGEAHGQQRRLSAVNSRQIHTLKKKMWKNIFNIYITKWNWLSCLQKYSSEKWFFFSLFQTHKPQTLTRTIPSDGR